MEKFVLAMHTSDIEQHTPLDEWWLSGRVVRGLQNGRDFGFPTINISLDKPASIEDTGVFATEVLMGGESYKGMLYVGTRPTLGLTEKTVEINIFDFDGDCYGTEVMFKIGQKVRSERKFSSIEELMKQLKKDKDEILQLFGN